MRRLKGRCPEVLHPLADIAIGLIYETGRPRCSAQAAVSPGLFGVKRGDSPRRSLRRSAFGSAGLAASVESATGGGAADICQYHDHNRGAEPNGQQGGRGNPPFE